MILDDIVARKRVRLTAQKSECSLEQMKMRAEKTLEARKTLSFEKALKKDKLCCICEVKKASPSKGLIREDFHPTEIAKEYCSAGADAISCLTEEDFFLGSVKYLEAVRETADIPVLRKDFIFDEYQVYEAAAAGADALLLIAAMLEPKQFEKLYKLAYSLGLDVLAEVHSPEELDAISFVKPKILGVNNRDLKTFNVDLSTVSRIKPYAPNDAVFVAESGIRNNEDMKMVRALGADAVLIGETLMRSGDITAELKKLREGV